MKSWRHLVGEIPTRLRASHPGGIECCVRVREDADEADTERLPGRTARCWVEPGQIVMQRPTLSCSQ